MSRDLPAYVYPIALGAISVGVATAERLFPWRRRQPAWRRALPSDLLHLAFNGHFLGVILHGIAVRYLLPPIDGWLARTGLITHVYRNLAQEWPGWAQALVALVVLDFVEWCVHVALHRVPLLWRLHQAHHSVVDGEMDWIVSFRFQWTEVVVYQAVLYLPLAFFGFSSSAVLFHAVVGTLIGHLNHANLDLGRGPWRYVLNSPRMHIWHHDHRGTARTTVNFGIIFSAWDWIFGTARMPDHPPPRLGFPGADRFPRFFLSQAAWPIQRLLGVRPDGGMAVAAGVLLLSAGWWLHRAPRPPEPPGFAMGERGASSQPARDPARVPSPASPAEATAALAHFGDAARAAGYAHPESMVATEELAAALGSPRLVVLDLRPAERFEEGHIPAARRVDRDDYAQRGPLPGLSVSRGALETLLRRRGVRSDSVVVLYGDGGPEPYRLWWALRVVGGYEALLLDGSLVRWKAQGRLLAEGTPATPAVGDVALPGTAAPARLRWAEVEPLARGRGAVLLDTRSEAEFAGGEQHPEAARAGHIPGARHLEWTRLLRGPGDPRLRLPDELWALFHGAGVGDAGHVVTACQSGTRSALAYFALLQLGLSTDRLTNYNGSWAEYSRLDLPLARGDR